MRAILFKDGTRFDKTMPIVAWAILQVAHVFWRNNLPFVLTSGQDRPKGANLNKTLHDEGLAFDVRSKHVVRFFLPVLLAEIKEELSFDFDVILEHKGQEQEHIHIEHDPK